MEEKLREIFAQICPGISMESHTLVDDELIDSLDVVSLVGELMDAFHVKISVDDIVPENFNSLEAMLALLRQLS